MVPGVRSYPWGRPRDRRLWKAGGHAARSRCCAWRHPWTRWSRAERGLIMNLIQKPRFIPLDPVDGYLPIIDHGLIGDGTTAGLVGRDGALVWLCLPRFDAPPLFCRLLDARRGGAFTIAPEDVVASRQCYEPSTGVLVTEMRSPSGLVQLTDALLLRAGVDLSEGIAA